MLELNVERALRDRRNFYQGYMKLCPNTIFVAEVKTRSDLSGWQSPHSRDHLLNCAITYGSWVAIHTNKMWGGAFEYIREAKEIARALPHSWRPFILAKGLHETDDEIELALKAGADYVLVVGRIPENIRCEKSRILIEPDSLEELARIPPGYKTVWNSRSLKDAIEAFRHGRKSDHQSKRDIHFSEARKVTDAFLVQASNIRTKNDVERSANAILVGSELVEFIRSFEE